MIFKTHSKKDSVEEGKLAGVMIPIDLHSYLTLYAIANEVTKSSVLRPLIEAWYKKTARKYTIRTLITMLSKAAQHEWDSRERTNTAGSFSDYLDEVRKDLTGVDPIIIDSIQKNIIR